MDIVKKPLPILLSALVVLSFAWNAFSANLMEQFVHFGDAANTIGALLRWIGMSGVIAVPLAMLYGRRDFGAAARCFVLPATVLSLFFTGAYFRVHTPAPYEVAAYWTSHVAMIAACAALFRTQGGKTAFGSAAVAFLWCFAGCTPLNLCMQIPELMRPRFLRFTTYGAWHFAAMLLFPSVAVGMFFGLRTRSAKTRTVFLFGASMALFFQLLARFSFVRLQDYQDLHGIVSVLPFYMCSFAMAVMPVAIASRSRSLQTALFLMNTPGALIAIVYPAIPTIDSVFHYNITYFVASHALLFGLTTQLPISLEARPERKRLGSVAALLGAYFVAMLVIDNVVTANGLSDPNFSYVTRCPLPIRLEEIGAVRWGWFRFSPLYLVILYLVHFCMCLATYGVYVGIAGRTARRRAETLPSVTDGAAAEAEREAAAVGETGELPAER